MSDGQQPRAASLLELDSVDHVFQSRTAGRIRALQNVSLDVEPGEFVSIVGPSGCGKSTLLRIIGGLIPPTSGSVRLGGSGVDDTVEEVAIVFQRPVLLPWKTVLDNVLFPVRLQRSVQTSDVEAARRLLDVVGLDSFEDTYPFELSGGMQQRAAIATALVTDPAVLLMDEPFGALDAMTREQMNVELNRLWRSQRKTVVLVTHDIGEAVFLSTRVLVMTARPGRFVGEVAIPFAEERTTDLLSQQQFAELSGRVRSLLDAEEAR